VPFAQRNDPIQTLAPQGPISLSQSEFARGLRTEILGLKPRSPREPRPDGKQQLGRKRDYRPLHYLTSIRASSWMGFLGGTGEAHGDA
jgi:hypothetical protein